MILKPLALCAMLAIQAACVACAETSSNPKSVIQYKEPDGTVQEIHTYDSRWHYNNGFIVYRDDQGVKHTLSGTIHIKTYP